MSRARASPRGRRPRAGGRTARLTVNASSSSAGPSPNRPCQSGSVAARRRPAPVSLTGRGPRALAARPRLGRQAPQAHEPFGVLVAERVLGVVRREVVVVERRAGARRPTASQRPASSRSRTSPVTCSCVDCDERVERVASAASATGRRRSSSATRISSRCFSRIDVALERDRLRGPGARGSARATPGTRRPRGS